MPPLDTARRLIRALSLPLPTRLANSPGTNSVSDAVRDEFIVDVELQDLSDSSPTSTPDTSRPATPIVVITGSVDQYRDHQLIGFPAAPATASSLRYRSRAVTRGTRYSFDGNSSRDSSRSSTRSTRSRGSNSTLSSSCDEVAVRRKRPATKRRESESCWKEYWD